MRTGWFLELSLSSNTVPLARVEVSNVHVQSLADEGAGADGAIAAVF